MPIARLSVRMISTESSLVTLSGIIEIDFRSLLPQTIQLPVTANGVDLSSWPTLAVQRAGLEKALAEQVANHVVK